MITTRHYETGYNVECSVVRRAFNSSAWLQECEGLLMADETNGYSTDSLKGFGKFC